MSSEDKSTSQKIKDFLKGVKDESITFAKSDTGKVVLASGIITFGSVIFSRLLDRGKDD